MKFALAQSSDLRGLRCLIYKQWSMRRNDVNDKNEKQKAQQDVMGVALCDKQARQSMVL